MDMEKQTLLRTNLTLQEQLKYSQAALLLEQVSNNPFALAFAHCPARGGGWGCTSACVSVLGPHLGTCSEEVGMEEKTFFPIEL